MKSKQTIIPPKLREEMAKDPFYSTCSLYGQHNHTCEGKVTWEHAMIYGGKKIQKKWAIIPLCEKGHNVNEFQDDHSMLKALHVWVALNRATQAELEEYTLPGVQFNKVDYFRELRRLNALYGVYKRIEPKPILSPLAQVDMQKNPVTGFAEIMTITLPPPLPGDILKAIEKMKEMGLAPINPAEFILQAIVAQMQAVAIMINNPAFKKPQNNG